MNQETFPIVKDPTPSLREHSRVLSMDEIFTPEFQAYLDKLAATMLVEDGVGIASPQIGRNIRAIIINPTGTIESWINPEIIKASDTMVESEEGCLSVPGVYGIVKRHKKIRVRAMNRHGRMEEMDVKGFPAIVWQHEIDHVNGILFVDKAERMIKTGKHI